MCSSLSVPPNYIIYLHILYTELDLEGVREVRSPAFGRAPWAHFCDHFEELHTVFIEVKLIINNAPLTYVYLNTIKKYLTPNHLLFGRQLLCYSNTTSAVIRNLTVLSSSTDKINHISNHFWHRWRYEFVVNLREIQRASKININSQKLCCASLWWKGVQRHFWRIAIVTGVLPSRGSDSKKER